MSGHETYDKVADLILWPYLALVLLGPSSRRS
jgi:hypothetical protein